MTELTGSDLKKLLAAGTAAKYSQYVDLLKRVKAGETLSLADQKLFDYLHSRLAEQEKDGSGFTTRRAIAQYLEDQGYKVKKSTVDVHIKAGKLRPDANGVYSTEAIDRYAAANLQRLDGTLPPELEKAQLVKMELDIRRERAETELAELKLESKRRDLISGPLERELAARFLVFRSDVENFMRGHANTIIAIVNGSDAKAPDLIFYLLGAAEDWLARYAEGKEFRLDEQGNVEPPYKVVDEAEDNDEDDDDAGE